MDDPVLASLVERGIELPIPPVPVANYVPAARAGDLLFLSGTIGNQRLEDGSVLLPIKGRLGDELTIAEGYQSARLAALNLVAAILGEVGNLSSVLRVVKLTGYVYAAPGFRDAPKVLNGASDLLGEVFGESGRHARAALYQHEMTDGAPIEIEAIIQVDSTLLNS